MTSSSTNNSMKVKGTLRMSEDSVVYDVSKKSFFYEVKEWRNI